ncbi:hypothetical protein AB0D83_20385 [Streptomyces decoyicus]|uniref:hypothetical protein n=1 Tax=Streptomyces decoyicus TaxID=249567 RepID=UPI0033C470E0
MDAEQRSAERWHPDRVRITPDQLVLLRAKRREILSQRLAQLEAHGRTPRVCLYGLNPVREQPARSFAAARAYTAGKGWRVGADRCIAPRPGKTDPMHRPGWRWVLHLIRAGHADGVVALTHSDISLHLDEYELQLDRVGHHGGFVALVTPEAAGEAVRPQVVTAPWETPRGVDETSRTERRKGTTCRTLLHTAHLGGFR